MMWFIWIYGRLILSDGPKPLLDKDGDPVFDHAWQAEVLAMAFTLIEEGHFSNADWSNALGAELAGADAKGQTDDAETYYNAAVTALEGLLAGAGVPQAEQRERKDAWTRAYENTPHGQPVELGST